jgi:hypothetical protein
MSEMLQLSPPRVRKHTIELSFDERTQLNAILDLLIPSDKDFPPPSSLHLIDVFLRQLHPTAEHKATLMLNEHRLRTTLKELNVSAGGNFCTVNIEKQQRLLRALEHQEPALFETLWTLVNHSYYKLLATR